MAASGPSGASVGTRPRKAAAVALVAAVVLAAAAPAAHAVTCPDAVGVAPYPTSPGATLGAGGAQTLTLGTLSEDGDYLSNMMHCEWRVCPADGETLAVQAQYAVMGPGAVLELTGDLGAGEAPHHRSLFQASTYAFESGEVVADPSTMTLLAPGQTVHVPGCVHLVARTMETSNVNPGYTLFDNYAYDMFGAKFNSTVFRPATGFEVTFTSTPGCAPGTIKVGDACENCPAGQTSVGVDATECVACSGEGGVFCAGTGLPEQSCPPGTFSPAGAAPAACEPCGPSETSLYGETACRACGNNAACHELDFGGLYKGGFKTTGYTASFAAATKMSADGLTMVVSGPGNGESAWIYTRAAVGERFRRTTMLPTASGAALDNLSNGTGSAVQGPYAGVMSVDMSPDGSVVCASTFAYSPGSFPQAKFGVLTVFERPGNDSWNADLDGSGPNTVSGTTFQEDTDDGAGKLVSAYGWRCRLAGTDRVLVSDPAGQLSSTSDPLGGVVWVYSKEGDRWNSSTATTTAISSLLSTTLSPGRVIDTSGFGFGAMFDTDASGEHLSVVTAAPDTGARAYKWNGTEYARQDDVLEPKSTVGLPFMSVDYSGGADTYLMDGRASGAPTAFAVSGNGEYLIFSSVAPIFPAGVSYTKPTELVVMKRVNDAWTEDGILNVTDTNMAFITSISNDGRRVAVLADNATPYDTESGRDPPSFPFSGYGTKRIYQRSEADGTWSEFASVVTDDSRPEVAGNLGARVDLQGASADLMSLVAMQQKHVTVDGKELYTATSNLPFPQNHLFLSDAYVASVGTGPTNYTAEAVVSYRPLVFDLCPAGTSCTAASGSATACPAGSFCTGGTAAPTACVAGKYCPEGSATEEDCAAGSYCTDATSQVACAAGKYCPEGSTTEADCAAGSFCATPASQVACAAGKYCPAGSTSGDANCTAGSYCPGAASELLCLAGKFCPEGSANQEDCAAGSYCATPVSQEACAAGKYCPAGSTTEEDCAAGSYCATPVSQVACAAGKYCPAGSTTEEDCPAGSFCADAATRANCTTAGASCPAGSVNETLCEPGFFCANTTSKEQCPAGSECPAGSTAAVKCELRSFASAAGSAACTECGAGQVPNAQLGAVACGECPDGSEANEDFTECEEGSPASVAAASAASTVAALLLAVVAGVSFAA